MNNRRKLIIFGNRDLAQLTNFYMLNDDYYHRRFEVVGYTINKEFIDLSKEEDQRLIPFETINQTHPPKDYSLFIPVSNNKLREKLYKEAKEKGYTLISYVSSKCTCFAWFIGENCFIQEDNTLQPYTHIGNNTILWAGNHIGHHSIIEDNCFITSHVVISGHCIIKNGSFLGVNSTLRDGITIGENSIVGMGSVVTKSIPNNEIWIGSPAKKKE
jgi:sugar O-acyltransferase (sialic acid O-acetyltransferase NeuD family)